MRSKYEYIVTHIEEVLELNLSRARFLCEKYVKFVLKTVDKHKTVRNVHVFNMV